MITKNYITIKDGANMSKRITYSEVIQSIATETIKEYQIIENEADRQSFKNNDTKIRVIHNVCGTEFVQSPHVIKNIYRRGGIPCPKCLSESKGSKIKNTIKSQYTYDWAIAKVSEVTNGEYCGIPNDSDRADYKDTNSPLHIKHLICGREFQKPLNYLRKSYIKLGTGCPHCAEDKKPKKIKKPKKNQSTKKLTLDEFWEKYHVDNYQIISKPEDYKNNKTKLIFKHLLCGNTYSVTPHDFQRGRRCPYCSRLASKSEKDVVEFIKENYHGQIMTNTRNVITPYELDIYLPELKIAIEFNGLFWHSEKIVGKKYHEMKLQKCQNLGIRLIQIFDDEWREKQDIVKSKIINILGLSKSEKFFARKCYCQDLTSADSSIVKEFLDKNHIQGFCGSSYQIGLYYGDRLLAIGCFNKLRASMNTKKISDGFDMIRYAADIQIKVIGGCSKIIEFFRKKYNCKYLKTLADLRWCSSTENMYITLGFVPENNVEPRYFYVDMNLSNDTLFRQSRFAFIKNKIKTKFPDIYDPKLTEFEMMDKANFIRVWDAGKITYSKTFD